VPVTELLAALERNAAAEAAQVRAAARERATALIARAAAEVDRRRAIALERLEREGHARVAREAATAERVLRERSLAARALVLERVFAEAATRLARAGIDLWQPAVPGLVADTLRFLEDRPALLRCPPDADRSVRHAVGTDRAEVTVEPSGSSGPGVRGESRDGRVVVDNTLLGRLERMRDDLAVQLARRLEPEAACAGTT
jgi:vacuolar-type H+-ATPase subunit E/Vma4